jgi:peptidyl-tRNA hydrolase, PTH1 family
MYLIVGLGNPGKKYQNTRHNIGFVCADSIAGIYQLKSDTNQYKSEVYKGRIDDFKVIVIKPMTFMNDSGKAISGFVNFFKIPVGNVIVIHDELDLPLGSVRIGVGNGTAGHNGLKSINSMIENKYIKIRVGIGRPANSSMVSDYVLNDFSAEEFLALDKIKKRIAECLPLILKEDIPQFLNNISK